LWCYFDHSKLSKCLIELFFDGCDAFDYLFHERIGHYKNE
jgi:hypothetical protein